MNRFTIRHAALASLLLAATWSHALPGAHGPDGQHLDGQGTAASAGGRPRLEAATEAFELVATLHETELSILVDRFATNEPVLGAKLEVESGGQKAAATFHADHGDYAVDDKAFLTVLAKPGEHALVFTLVAGQDTDLIDGTLTVRNAAAVVGEHGHSHDRAHHRRERAAWIAAAIAATAVVAALLWWRSRRARTAVSSREVAT